MPARAVPKPAPLLSAAPAPPEAPAPAPTPTATPAVPLTPEQQARLAELDARTRDRVLTWLATGDRVLVAEALKLLRPLAPPPPPPPRTTPELIARLPEDPTYPVLLAEALAREFDDRKSWKGFLKLGQQAWQGELPVEALAEAYRQACGPKAKSPGAILHHALRSWSGRRA